MKKIFIIAAAAAMTATACSDKQIAGGNQNEENAIGFRPVTHKPTRAAETTIQNIKDFKVFGLWNGSYDFMYSVGVIRGDGSTWSYAPVRYWPSTGDVDFYAYSPAGSRGIVHSEMFPRTSSVAPVIPFTVSPDNVLQEDFLVTAAPAKNKSNTGGQVQLNFAHALSQLVFEVRNAVRDVNFEITDIVVTGLCTDGEINMLLVPQSGRWNEVTVPVWTITNNNVVSDFAAPINIISVPYEPQAAKYTRLSGPNDGLMVLPQEFSNSGNGSDADGNGIPDDYEADNTKNYLKVTYGVKLNDGSVEIVPAGTTIYLSFNGLLSGFEIGKKYIFQIDLTGSAVSLDPIDFTVSGVTDWTEETVDM